MCALAFFLIPFTSAVTISSGTNISLGLFQRTFVYEGDSLSALEFAEPYSWYLNNINAEIKGGKNINVATPGDRIMFITGEYATEVHPYADSHTNQSYFLVWAGSNDLATGSDASTTMTNLKTEWGYARADGFKVVAFTIMPRCGYNSTEEAYRVQLNDWIIGNSTFYDYLVRPDLILTNCSNTTYFADGTHPTPAGALLLAQNISSLFNESSIYGINNSTLEVDFPITFDQMDVTDNAITFYNLTYTHPSSCNSQSSSYTTYNYTTANQTALLSSVLPSVACVLSPSSGGGGGGGAAPSSPSSSHQVVFSTTKNVPAKVNLTSISDVLSEFYITANQTVASASIVLSNVNVSTSESSLFSNGKAYKSYQFIPSGVNDSNLNSVLIYFNVNKSWFSLNDLNLSSLALYRKADVAGSGWTALPTNFLDNNSLTYNFVASSPGFSNYTIFAGYLNNGSSAASGNEGNAVGENQNQSSGSSAVGSAAKTALEDFKSLAGKVGYWAIFVLVFVAILAVAYFVLRDAVKRHTKKIVKEANNRGSRSSKDTGMFFPKS